MVLLFLSCLMEFFNTFVEGIPGQRNTFDPAFVGSEVHQGRRFSNVSESSESF